jgi:hypothetical protein
MGEKEVQIRQVAMRAPMVWDLDKVWKVGWWNETLGALGMGDLDVSNSVSHRHVSCKVGRGL